ncbi:EAL domain-containing protein [Chitinivorax sp. B]|uniref:bifunctional diguanylate cyclase/phosphodiesterase n=1 Tax=Chitinivorax sp. B TaxID=2502235 RepID=UPI0010FA5896|nr:EAL domain-containing protein [Chitinivorax sp. B]
MPTSEQPVQKLFGQYVVLVIGIMMFLIVGLAWLLYRTAIEQNEISFRSEQTLIRALLDTSRHHLATSLSDYAVWDEMDQRVGRPLNADLAWFESNTTATVYANLQIDLMLLVDERQGVLRLMNRGEWLSNRRFDLNRLPTWQALVSAALNAPANKVVTEDLRWGGENYRVAAQRIQPQATEQAVVSGSKTGRVMLFARSLGKDRLFSLLREQNLPELAVVAVPPERVASLRLTPLPGESYITWRSAQSGTAFLQALWFPAALFMLLILVLCLLVTKDARLRHSQLATDAMRQANHRKALVALVDLLHLRHNARDLTDPAFWRQFLQIVMTTFQARRVSLLSYQLEGQGIDIIASTGSGDAVPNPTPEHLTQQRVLLSTDPWPCASAAITRDGRLVGELQLERTAAQVWTSDEANFLVAVAALVTLAFETFVRQGAEANLYRRMHFDLLTGLPSQLSLPDGKVGAIPLIDTHGFCALAVLRIDGLEDVNIVYGRESGDTLLTMLAERFANKLVANEQVSRSGGKRFDLLLGGDTSERVRERLEDLVKYAAEPVLFNGRSYQPRCRIGAVLCNSKDIKVERMQEANLALDCAVQSGRDRVVWYHDSLLATAARRVAVTQGLRYALSQEALSLAYQPFVDARSGLPIGAEVLLRWTHPELGPVSPAEFIPIAEEEGIIVALGDWVLSNAMSQLRQWNERLPIRLKLAVNLSPRQLEDETLAVRIIELLRQHDVAHQSIEFEVTEGLALETAANITKNLKALRAADMNVAIDDFGTGYATFSFLRRYEVQKIKLDKMFIDELGQPPIRQLVQSMITMSRGLGAKVTAEGVETVEQRHILSELGCDYLQGYYFARPMDALALAAWVENTIVARQIPVPGQT